VAQNNWKTLRVPPEAYEKAKAQKEEHNRTWGEQLVCNNTTTTEAVDVDNIVATLVDEIRAETIINVEDARLIGQNVDKTVAPYAEDIEGYIKDLETNIQRKTAEELQR